MTLEQIHTYVPIIKYFDVPVINVSDISYFDFEFYCREYLYFNKFVETNFFKNKTIKEN